MRTPKTSQTYVCLSCLLRTGATTKPAFSIQPPSVNAIDKTSSCSYTISSSPKAVKRLKQDVSSSIPNTNPIQRIATSSTPDHVVLNKSQMAIIGKYHSLQQKIHNGLSQIPEAGQKDGPVSIESALAVFKSQSKDVFTEAPFLRTLEEVYAGRLYEDVQKDLLKINRHRRPSENQVEDGEAIDVLGRLGLLTPKVDPKRSTPIKAAANTQKENERTKTTGSSEDAANGATSSTIRKAKIPPRIARIQATQSAAVLRKTSSLPIRKSLSTSPLPPPPRELTPRPATGNLAATRFKGLSPEASPIIIKAPSDAKSLDGSLIPLSPIEKEATLPVPKLSFDLSRVLFNPGVYHLQDPRSRVYNFDPYLEKIMPVSEFNFDALNPYITSSQDNHLRNVSLKHNKRYIGSTSSMSGVMSHFHFLFSAWRPLDLSMMSKKIDGTKNFTVITRAPGGIFLRWRDGVYAIDADKEHDTPNILMMQGKSMEKLLTLEKDDFEKYRRPKAGDGAPSIDSDPESYHYSGCENFLLRSQLDAWDPRLPGTGMFDLKTRACAGIRMDMSNYGTGMGYQIKERFGEWESYDREYFDMMRAAFLKYSIQVRMGRMDGIFVAYHNIERIFGFQYISLAEMDAGIHGQSDPCVGDREFKMTIKMMNEVFDLATKEYPKQSLRLLIETRDPTKTDPNGIMRIFAEPMSEEKIDKIQNEGKSRVAEFEKNLARDIQQARGEPIDGRNMGGQTLESKLSPSTLESNSADLAFMEEILGQDDSAFRSLPPNDPADKVSCWSIKIHNEVNGRSVIRPQNITSSDRWIVKYSITRVPDTQARGLYTSCKNRRTATLTWDVEAKKDNYFIERIRELSAAGRVWRDEQDEKDSHRDRREVLYNQGGVTSESP